MGEEINPGFVNDCGAIHDVTNKGEERRGDEAEVRLQRNLGLFSGVSLIVGNISKKNRSISIFLKLYLCRYYSRVWDLGDSWLHPLLL